MYSVFVEGSLLYKPDSKNKWLKVWAILMFSDTEQTLLVQSSDAPDANELASMNITPDCLVLGPTIDTDKKVIFQLMDHNNEMYLAGETGMATITWIDTLGTLVDVLRDGTESAEAIQNAMKEKLEALQNRNVEEMTMNKWTEYAQIELKRLRPTNWLETDVLVKKNVLALDEKVSNKRERVIYEFLLTEQSYVRSLLILLHVFKNPIKKYLKELSLNEEHFMSLFSNLEDIIGVNSILLEDLMQCFKSWVPDQLLSPLVIKSAKNFKVYKPYSANYQQACSTYEELKKKKSNFNMFLRQLEEDPLCKGLPLPAYLIMPIQRIPRYVLLITEILKFTEETHVDYKGLVESLETVKNAAKDVNAAPKEQEDYYKTEKVIVKFEKWKDLQLKAPNRYFIKKGNLSKVCHHGGLKSRTFFLFTDLFFYASKSPSTGKWTVIHQFLWLTLSVSDETSRENAIRITSDKSSYLLIAKDADDKKEWMNCFSTVGVVNKAVAENVAPIWLPDTKDCMLCSKKFTQLRRRHHCRRCGWVVCASCSNNSRVLPGQGKVKVCDNCVRDEEEDDRVMSIFDYLGEQGTPEPAKKPEASIQKSSTVGPKSKFSFPFRTMSVSEASDLPEPQQSERSSKHKDKPTRTKSQPGLRKVISSSSPSNPIPTNEDTIKEEESSKEQVSKGEGSSNKSTNSPLSESSQFNTTSRSTVSELPTDRKLSSFLSTSSPNILGLGSIPDDPEEASESTQISSPQTNPRSPSPWKSSQSSNNLTSDSSGPIPLTSTPSKFFTVNRNYSTQPPKTRIQLGSNSVVLQHYTPPSPTTPLSSSSNSSTTNNTTTTESTTNANYSVTQTQTSTTATTTTTQTNMNTATNSTLNTATVPSPSPQNNTTATTTSTQTNTNIATNSTQNNTATASTPLTKTNTNTTPPPTAWTNSPTNTNSTHNNTATAPSPLTKTNTNTTPPPTAWTNTNSTGTATGPVQNSFVPRQTSGVHAKSKSMTDNSKVLGRSRVLKPQDNV
eukprot:TRINITY_DN1683_c0_g1_i1.p1 TRINITY_DN1683_c0_g1~~TRINITY_DN1683_c0_g1_i1.p1  ORF type:complete len:1008 (-),score=197.75 TRINITY_DN1683_c0_g1_i1:84-3107(-)